MSMHYSSSNDLVGFFYKNAGRYSKFRFPRSATLLTRQQLEIVAESLETRRAPPILLRNGLVHASFGVAQIVNGSILGRNVTVVRFQDITRQQVAIYVKNFRERAKELKWDPAILDVELQFLG